MSKVTEFYEALSKDEAMQERAKGLNAAVETTEEAVAEAVVAFAKGEGYAFTAGELKDYGKELSDEELAAVAGGASNICLIGGGGGGVSNCLCVFFGHSTYQGERFICAGLGNWKHH
jgi:predicted ribosomally synthesized peptide with nif11-like leader